MKKKLVVALLLLIILKFISLLAEENHICDYCHKPIIGEYLQVGEKYFHPNHFICNWCKKPIKSDKFIELDGKYYHEKCFYKHVVPRCVVCGKPIKGAYLKNYWGQIYHPYHQNEIKKCEYCSRIIKHPHKDKNGLYICNICERKKIDNINDAKTKIEEIVRILYSKGIKIELNDVEIKLVSLEEIKKVALNPNLTSDNKGLAEYKIKKFPDGRTQKTYRIFILKDMPDFTFVEVAAHELMHIWIYEHGEQKQEAALVEGSCNYASFLVLNKLKDYNSFRFLNLKNEDIDYDITKLEKNADPIYGGGFRTVKKYVDKFGIFMWLNYLKHHKNLPRNF